MKKLNCSQTTFWQKCKKTIKKISIRLPNKVAILFIQGYRLIFSPSVGILHILPLYPRPSCVFYPTCSQYGIEVFQKYPFWKAFYKTVHRIHRCKPSTEPQIDLP